MEWPKVKNIILLILVLINGFLLVLVLGQQQKVRQYEQSALTGAAQVLARNGIIVAEEALVPASSLPTLTAGRDLQLEQALAQALLGEEAARSDQSGGLYLYSSDWGTALFRPSGEFVFTLSDWPLNGQQPADHAAALLERMEVSGQSLGPPVEDGAGGCAVSFRQLLGGVPLYSCQVTFQYSAQQLLSVSGALVIGSTAPAAEGQQNSLDMPTALIRFLEGVLARGDVCSSIDSMGLGYRTAQTFSSGVRLTPVWLVSTNIADYYLDALTGELEPAS